MKTFASAVGVSVALLASADRAFANINMREDAIDPRIKGRNDTLEQGAQSIMAFITSLLYIIAVGYALYGGFLILNSGGDEEKVKKGKAILMHGALGLLVIFLASSIVSFILRMVTSA